MKVGITLPQAGQQATRENVIHIAQNAESEGFDSLWVFERLLWPINPQTPYPATPDGSLPSEYQTIFDPLETLTFVAANTNKIALGTSVIDMLFHNPVVLARRFATLDVLSEELFVDSVLDGPRMNTKHPIFRLKIKEKGQMNFFKR